MATFDATSGAGSPAIAQHKVCSRVFHAPADRCDRAAAGSEDSGSSLAAAVALLSMAGGAYLGFLDFGANGGVLRAIGAAGLGFVLSIAVLHIALHLLKVVFQFVKIGVQVVLVGAAVLTIGNLMDFEWAATATTQVYKLFGLLASWAEPLWTHYGPR